jgi:hypothetical protein
MLINAYRLSDNEIYLMKKLEKVYHSQGCIIGRWPEIYYANHDEFDNRHPFDLKDRDGYLADGGNNYEAIFITDYLGVYIYEHGKEGQIRIYKDRIEKCAKRISHALQIDFNEAIDVLRLKVLLHELGHWFSLWLFYEKYNGNNYLRIKLLSKEVTESLAQLSIPWAIQGLKNNLVRNIDNLFKWIVPRQPHEYGAFLEINVKTSHKAKILRRYKDILNDPNKDIDYLLKGK